ncbi:NYN domain-containing protein [Burkholderia sp. FERM BP-3421]|uniref:NYN domain-containing protein n=1 Tax=Burkholderia sp. FERM BP-3421 TaxID=1494466 RepID=UPI00235F2088|nr:NYN domain-containing protein [Burkholderia sp. FERM BP-3421]WDD92453.1 NYN domain-containing protein [Burkholderia sp. FERM BP-3421]
MALFCDFENIALGVRDTKFEKFDIKPVLERLLLKGSIVVKKAYCDWDRYKTFKASMHEASFELIEIPHVRQSGKNSADIRLVVDALDLCYTKSHVDTFVIISGDSDFSPLVSKLRENAKRVIGVGVKNSTSDLLVANCDEFIFYDDLAREQQRANAKQEARTTAKRTNDDDKQRKHDGDARKAEAISIAVETFEALASERGESGKIWASVLKSAIKRRKPGFNESYYGFRAFGNLLEEAQARGLLEIGRDDKSGTFVFRSLQTAAAPADASKPAEGAAPAQPAGGSGRKGHRKGQGKHKPAPEQSAPLVTEAPAAPVEIETRRVEAGDAQADAPLAVDAPAPAKKAPRTRKTAAKKTKAAAPRATDAEASAEPAPPAAPTAQPAPEGAPAKAPRKTAPRARRPRKAAETPAGDA